jgi:hypothetical protein
MNVKSRNRSNRKGFSLSLTGTASYLLLHCELEEEFPVVVYARESDGIYYEAWPTFSTTLSMKRTNCYIVTKSFRQTTPGGENLLQYFKEHINCRGNGFSLSAQKLLTDQILV